MIEEWMRAGASESRTTAGARSVLTVALCLALMAARAGAVVIDGGDGSGNASAPPDDPGWDHVGTIAGLTGIYLGRGWVLTANHANPSLATDIVLGGVAYPAIPGTGVLLETSPGAFADLIVYRIQGQPDLPDLPALRLSSGTPGIGDEVTLIGNSWSRAAQITYWDESWTEVTPALASFRGYAPSGPRVLRWGRNAVSNDDSLLTLNGLTTQAFEAVFDFSTSPDHVADESVVVSGDSGGAAFLKRNGQWELVGVLFARLIFTGQVDGGDKAVFGNVTEAADVAFYRSQIEAATAPISEIPALPVPSAAVLGGALLLLGARAARRTMRGRVAGGG
jgi:hypothetical protein